MGYGMALALGSPSELLRGDHTGLCTGGGHVMARDGTGGVYAHQALETEARRDRPRGRYYSGFFGSTSQMLFSTPGSCRVEKNSIYDSPGAF